MKLKRLHEAARKVAWFEWSDNDQDAVDAVQDMREALKPFEES